MISALRGVITEKSSFASWMNMEFSKDYNFAFTQKASKI